MTDDLSRGFSTDSDTAAHTNGAAESGPGIGGDAFTGAVGDDSLSGQAQIEVGKPAAGETVQIDAQPGQTYVLDFDPAEAQALVQGDNLVLIFPDGAQIVFENLVALVQQEDGPSLLVAGTDLIPLLVAQGIIPGVHEGFELNQPDPGETIVVTAEAGQRYIINFDPALAQVQVDGDDLVLVFANGGRIVIQDLGTLAGGPGEPVFDIAGNEVPGGTLFGQAVALGGEEGGPQGLPTLETAAGETVPTSGGVGDYSDDFGQDIGLLNPQGVIPPVELAFGVPLLEPGPVEGVAAGAPSLTATFKTTVPGFGVGTFPGGFEDWQPLQHVGDHSEFAMKILPTFTPADPDQDLTGLTISGIPSGAKFFVGGTAPGDEIAVVGGKVTLTPAQIADGLYLLPPADSDHDIPLTFTANFENADGSTGSVVAHGTAVIDAVADQPMGDLFQGELGDAFFTVGAEGGQFDSFSVYGGDGDVLDPTDGGEFCLTEGGRVFVQIDALFGDFLDGSETHTYVIEGVPDDWTENFDSAGVTGVDFVKQVDGTWLATVSGDGPTGWISFNTNGWTGETTLTVKAVADENPPSDGELTLANNVAEIVGQVTLCIDEDTPIVGEPTNMLVDEDDLVPFGTDQTAEPAGDRIDEGSVSVDFFSDQPGNLTAAFAFTGGSPATGPNGEAVTYTPSGDGQSMTASIGGVDIFTVEITGATDNGGGNVTYDYQITLLNEMDHLIGDNGENTFDFTADFTVTDSDGDSASSSFDATVVDDVPLELAGTITDTVYENELATVWSTGNDQAGITGDDDNATAGNDDTIATGSVASLVDFGADGPAAGGGFSLASDTSSLDAQGWTSQGETVKYSVSGDTLTAYVDVGGGTPDAYDGGTDRAIFTLVLAANGDWTFTLMDQLDHVIGDGNDASLTIDLSTMVVATDGDGDSITLADGFTIAVVDDTPVVLAKTDLIYANSTGMGTGVFDYAVGADERASYSSSDSDFSAILLTGTVDGNNIENPDVQWVSEDSNTAVFSVTFDYAPNPGNPDSTVQASGTLTFDKVDGTYTLDLDIQGFSLFTTSNALDFQGYVPGSSTEDNSGPADVVVAQLTDNFFVQFTGIAEPGAGTGSDNLFTVGDGTPGAFADGDLFSQASASVTVSSTAAGVAGNTIQRGEVLEMDFFTFNPEGFTATTPDALVTDMFLKFDGIGSSEDLVVVLKLVDANDSNITTTVAIIVDNEDIFTFGDTLPAEYNITLDNNDGVVIIESNDYNINPGDNWLIDGAQVLVSTEGITGSGIDLNGATGDSGGSSGTESFSAATVDNDVIKISDIGFVTSESTTEDADLQFNFSNIDSDGDTTAGQILNVHIEGTTTFDGTDSAEAIQGSANGDTIDGAGGNDIIYGAAGDDDLTGGSGVDTFVYDLGADEGSDTITDFDHTSDVLSFSDVVDGGGNDVADVDAMISSIANDGGGHVQVTFNSGTVIDLTSVAFAGQTSIADLVDNPDQIQVTHV